MQQMADFCDFRGVVMGLITDVTGQRRREGCPGCREPMPTCRKIDEKGASEAWGRARRERYKRRPARRAQLYCSPLSVCYGYGAWISRGGGAPDASNHPRRGDRRHDRAADRRSSRCGCCLCAGTGCTGSAGGRHVRRSASNGTRTSAASYRCRSSRRGRTSIGCRVESRVDARRLGRGSSCWRPCPRPEHNGNMSRKRAGLGIMWTAAFRGGAEQRTGPSAHR